MRIAIPMDADLFEMFNPSDVGPMAYTFGDYTQEFCGSSNCIFLDTSNVFQLQKEVMMIPYTNNCILDSEHMQYSGDNRGYYPKQNDSVFIFGIGSFIAGDEFGSDDITYESRRPYILNPERRVRISYAKLTWKFEDVATKFNASCNNVDCLGLFYQLHPSGRYLFAGREALPLSRIQKADFHAPIPLVELNTPTVFFDELEWPIEIERLGLENFNSVKWNRVFSGFNCSMLMDSYTNQGDANNYFFERPLQVMYTSVFYYLFDNGAVTEMLDTRSVINASLNASFV